MADHETRTPTKPGLHWAREVRLDMLGQRMLSGAFLADVVEGVPNPRNHRLLVKTGGSHPRYRSLNCYEWISEEEGLADRRQLAQAFGVGK